MHRRRLEKLAINMSGARKPSSRVIIIQLVFRVDGGYCQLEEGSASSYPEAKS
jgi:hypothetical protein